jgi:hypothetical protein
MISLELTKLIAAVAIGTNVMSMITGNSRSQTPVSMISFIRYRIKRGGIKLRPVKRETPRILNVSGTVYFLRYGNNFRSTSIFSPHNIDVHQL